MVSADLDVTTIIIISFQYTNIKKIVEGLKQNSIHVNIALRILKIITYKSHFKISQKITLKARSGWSEHLD